MAGATLAQSLRAASVLAAALALGLASACATTPAPPAAAIAQPPPAAAAPPRALPPTAINPPHMQGRRVVRAALLLPFSSASPPVREEAAALLAAAELALFENADNTFLLIPKDAGVTPEQAVAAVRAAVADGADVILGPLFSSSVAAAAPAARTAGVPIITFSSDREVAGRGVYMLSFLPEEETERIVSFAARSGVRQLVTLTPDTDYGARVAAAARNEAQRAGVTLAGQEVYPRGVQNLAPPAERAGRIAVTAPVGQGAILIPERGNLVRALAAPLAAAGVTPASTRFLGTGLWADTEVTEARGLAGAWFAAPDPTVRGTFERRFRQTFERPPTRLAGMGYDATALVARLTRRGDLTGLSRESLEKPEGFVGVDGLFRFRADGTTERGLAVHEATGTGSRVIDPAPMSFQGR
jgi:branched-chain amino acid transport system substrate-binding protein